MGGILPPKRRIYFERTETRVFLQYLATNAFPEISVINEPGGSSKLIYVRHGPNDFFPAKPITNLWYLRTSASFEIRNIFLHKCFFDFGGTYKKNIFRPRNLLTHASGTIYFWMPPYPEIYDGWQEINIAFRNSKKSACTSNQILEGKWKHIVDRIKKFLPNVVPKKEVLLVPEAGYFKDFDDPFLCWLDKLVSVKVARFKDDSRYADVRFESVLELADLIRNYKVVITNDSLSSHIAQFLSFRHILICSSSRPGNVCYPGAKNTYIVDFGSSLDCRPCSYFGKGDGLCAADQARCKGQLILNESKKSALAKALDWAA